MIDYDQKNPRTLLGKPPCHNILVSLGREGILHTSIYIYIYITLLSSYMMVIFHRKRQQFFKNLVIYSCLSKIDFLLTWPPSFIYDNLVSVMLPQKPCDYQTLLIYEHVRFHAHSMSLSHQFSDMLTHTNFLFLMTMCKTKWDDHSFLNP